jgi:hypothetical protein
MAKIKWILSLRMHKYANLHHARIILATTTSIRMPYSLLQLACQKRYSSACAATHGAHAHFKSQDSWHG